MIILDTNVISELTQPIPANKVQAWLEAQRDEDLHLTTICEAELLYGLAIMPTGKRRRDISAAVNRALHNYRDRILPFTRSAAAAYSELAAQRRSAGLPVKNFDCQIAAIARSVGADIATRNVKDFEGCGIGIIDPWQYQT